MKSTLAVFVFLVSSAFANSGQDLFQKGLVKERTEADFRGAIKLYERVVKEHSSDRKLAAQALFRIAECQQALGSQDARAAYERVVQEFADQKEVVAAARAHLGNAGSQTGIVARQLWKEGGSTEATISPDGRTLALGGLVIRDLATGKTTSLYDPKTANGFAEWPVLSADSRSVAYAWYSQEDHNYQVRIADARAGAKPRAVLRNPEFTYYFLKGWSRDEKSVLSIINMRGNTAQLAWISVADGAVKTLKSLEWRSPGLASLSPDGRFIAYDVLAQRDSSEREVRVLASDGSSETVLVPPSGNNVAPVWTPDGTRVLFLSKRSGNFGLWMIPVRDGKAAGAAQLVKADTGQIEPLGFTHAGSLLYIQTMGNLDVFSARIDLATGKMSGDPVRVADTFVGSNQHPAWSPDGKSIAYISLRTATGETTPATLVVRSAQTGQEKTISTTFTYPAPPMWFGDSQSILIGSRNSQNNTSLYKVDLKTGDVRELINLGTNAPPGMALAPDGKTAYGAPLDKKPGIVAAFDLATGRRTDIHAASNPIFGLAASPYGRRIAFVAEPREGTGPTAPSHLYVANPDGSGVNDLFADYPQHQFVTAITWSPDSRWIYFVRSESPRLGDSHESQLWRVPAAGGPSEFTGLSARNIGRINFSPDGTGLVYGGGESVRSEFWALDNLLPILKAAK